MAKSKTRMATRGKRSSKRDKVSAKRKPAASRKRALAKRAKPNRRRAKPKAVAPAVKNRQMPPPVAAAGMVVEVLVETTTAPVAAERQAPDLVVAKQSTQSAPSGEGLAHGAPHQAHGTIARLPPAQSEGDDRGIAVTG
jgi:hypothetical protein